MHSTSPTPLQASTVATASLVVVLLAAALGASGALGLAASWIPSLFALGTLQVAVGVVVLAGTLAAAGLRAASDRGDPDGRRRAGRAAALGLLLPLALLAAPPQAFRGRGPVTPSVSPAATPPGSGATGAATGSIPVKGSADQTFERAVQTAEQLGWRIVSRDATTRRIVARSGAELGPGGEVTVVVRPADALSALVDVRALTPSGQAAPERTIARIQAFAARLRGR